jgi:hypothetical protein
LLKALESTESHPSSKNIVDSNTHLDKGGSEHSFPENKGDSSLIASGGGGGNDLHNILDKTDSDSKENSQKLKSEFNQISDRNSMGSLDIDPDENNSKMDAVPENSSQKTRLADSQSKETREGTNPGSNILAILKKRLEESKPEKRPEKRYGSSYIPETNFDKYFDISGDWGEKTLDDKNNSLLEKWITEMKNTRSKQKLEYNNKWVEEYLKRHLNDPGIAGDIARREYKRRHT